MGTKGASEPAFYLRFYEACGWERECWVFYIPLTERNLEYMSTLQGKLVNWKMTGEGQPSPGIDEGSRFKFLVMPVTRAKALKDCERDAGGYMSKYNLTHGEVKRQKLRKVWGKKATLEEALYKGGITQFFEAAAE